MTKQNNKYSVVIPTMWYSDRLYKMLNVYQNECRISEIIIIDNNPKNKQRKISGRKIKIYSRGENIYVNPAWNWGVSLAENENVILANDDITIGAVDLMKSLSYLHTSSFELVGVDYNNTRKSGILKIQESKRKEYGFGCFMYVKKSRYIQLPYDLKIWRGDFLLHKHLKTGVISGIYIDTDMSTTVNKFNDVAKQDIFTYRTWDIGLKSKPKDLSVVIITYNRIEYTKECIRTLELYTDCNYFVTIIDNGSTDGTREYLKTLDKSKYMIILSEENLMPARSNRIGLKLSPISDYYFLCDNDGLFTENWFKTAKLLMSNTDMICLRKSRWLLTNRFKEESLLCIHNHECYETVYVGSFTIMNQNVKNVLVNEISGTWIGNRIGRIAKKNGYKCLQMKDGVILDQSDNDFNNPQYFEQYKDLWGKKNRLKDLMFRIETLNNEN